MDVPLSLSIKLSTFNDYYRVRGWMVYHDFLGAWLFNPCTSLTFKSLNENCSSLQSIHINTGTGKAREFLKGAEGYYQFPPNLRDQVATKLHHISAFNRDSKNLTTVIVHTVALKNGVYVLKCYGFTAKKQLL